MDNELAHGKRDIPHATINEFFPLPEPKDQYPLEYMERASAMKLHDDGTEVVIGICDPQDIALQENLRAFHDRRVRFVQIDRSELAVHLGRRLASTPSSLPQSPDNEKLLLDRLANDAPVVNMVNGIFIEGIRAGASDIHIEAFHDFAAVRLRVDGVLSRSSTFDKDMFPAVASRVKIMANLNIMERRLPQDGRLTVHIDGNVLDMRVSVMPIADGESIVLRVLGNDRTHLALEELGFRDLEVAHLQRLSRLPHGLVLSTGPTGSGKTTTLKAMLRQIDAEERKLITIEDPIEYLLPGVDQVQTNDRIGLTFESILRRVLRQDPDVIMVGEIRDKETAELAVRLALTGHLVFSTLHTNDSVSAVARLRNIGIPSYLTGAVLRAVVAQRLVRRLCYRCRVERSTTVAEKRLLASEGVVCESVFSPSGCSGCRQTGYLGRTAIVEMFMVDSGLEELIVSETTEAAILKYCRDQDMRSLMRDGLEKVGSGETSFEEIQRTVMLE